VPISVDGAIDTAACSMMERLPGMNSHPAIHRSAARPVPSSTRSVNALIVRACGALTTRSDERFDAAA